MTDQPLFVFGVAIPGAPDYSITRDGDVYSHKFGKLRKLKTWHTFGRDGKPSSVVVSLNPGHGVSMTRLVHLLVLAAFAGPRQAKTSPRHLNGDVLDNRAENLEWATPAVKKADRAARGEVRRRNRAGRYSVDDIASMRAARTEGWTYRQIAEARGCSVAYARVLILGVPQRRS